MEFRKVFSERLSALKDEHGSSTAEIANSLGLSNEAVRLMLHGRRAPGFDALIALADLFDVSLDYLVGRSDDPKRR